MGRMEFVVCPLCFRNRKRVATGRWWAGRKGKLTEEIRQAKEKPERAGQEVRFDLFDCQAGRFISIREGGGKRADTDAVGRGKAPGIGWAEVDGLTLAQAAQRLEYAPLIAQLGKQLAEIQGCLGSVESPKVPERAKVVPVVPGPSEPPPGVTIPKGFKWPKTAEEAEEQSTKLEEMIDTLQEKLDDMENPDTKAGERLQERIEALEAYKDAVDAWDD